MIDVTDIHKSYRLGEVKVNALRGVSLRIDRGEFVAIMGPSGSGKSTLMHILGLLDTPEKGVYRLDGRNVSGLGENERAELRARSIGFVFQQFNLLPRVSARENVALPLIYSAHPAPASPESLLEWVGLGNRKDHAPNELSGGEQQRVAIARSLVNMPLVVMADEPTGNLDSSSSQQIMGILKELNRSGLTVLVVTHNPDVAAIADRVLTIRDGQVVGDAAGERADLRVLPGKGELGGKSGLGEEASAGRAVGNGFSRERRGAWGYWHRAKEGAALLKQAARALSANKTRTFLSMLGVLIGVAAVIAVMALGAGAKMAVEERIAAMGANLLVLRPGGRYSRGVALGAGTVSRLALNDADFVRSKIAAVEQATPTVRGTVQVTHGNRNWRTTVIGALPVYAQMHDLAPQLGRFFSETEVRSRAGVAVIGLRVWSELFGTANPIGKTIRVNKMSFRVIGVLPEKGASFHFDRNDQILIPITTAMRRLLGRDYVDSIELQVELAEQLDYVESAAIDLMKERHRVDPDNQDAFSVRNLADIQSAIESTSNTMALLLAGIGAISLLVGGIGIMNIMLVSVTERTREIGLRKAVGARRTDILVQFLVEAVVVSACGGLIGIALGWSASFAMSRLAGWVVAVTGHTILVAFAFSALVGIVFGLWPARKASALEPIEALRYE